MNRLEALETIRRAWNDEALPLGERIITISSCYSDAGLDLASTAAFIHATPAELDALISLGELSDETLEVVSRVNPPKTAWMMLASANDEEVEGALAALSKARETQPGIEAHTSITEYVYTSMLDVSGPTIEQAVGALPGDALYHALKKGTDFKALNDWETRFLKSVAGQKKRGKTLTEKQVTQLVKALTKLVDAGAIKRDSIDGDSDICNAILDALGK